MNIYLFTEFTPSAGRILTGVLLIQAAAWDSSSDNVEIVNGYLACEQAHFVLVSTVLVACVVSGCSPNRAQVSRLAGLRLSEDKIS